MEGDGMAVIGRRAARVIQRGEWPDNKTHGLWRAECMIDWLKAEGIELVDADQHRGAVEAARALGSAWRANDDEAISNALVRLEDACGLREQGGQ
jgi:hypothetical protein